MKNNVSYFQAIRGGLAEHFFPCGSQRYRRWKNASPSDRMIEQKRGLLWIEANFYFPKR